MSFLASTGAIVLTFLAGAELDPAIFKTKWKEAVLVGIAGFMGPFLGAAAIAHWVPVKVFRYQRQEAVYYTLMMSTGLTFGTISALFGLSHGIITPDQYSHLVATVIGSAVVPAIITNAFFMPVHLRPGPDAEAAGEAEMAATRRGAGHG